MIKDNIKLITSLTLTVFLSASGVRSVMAQMPGSPGAPGAPGASGPIDITADEQEFSGDAVIARGKVRVIYKDSVIVAPLATLYKDPSGNPNRAIFTGHPRLTQGNSKIDANTLTFEMQKQKILAEGNAHSEVDVPEDEQKDSDLKSASKPFPAPPVAQKSQSDDDDAQPQAATGETQSQPSEAKKDTKKTVKKPAEKIITDSERQEYDQATGHFDASGHVKVVHGDITVFADKLQLVYSATSNKPETALFSGHVTATQGKNTTCADNMNYSLSTKRLQASGNVKSKVIQDKKEAPKKKETAEPTANADLFGAPAKASSSKSLNGSASAVSIAGTLTAGDGKPVWIYSDAQDYSRDTGRVAAHGNVRVVSGEMYGCGPSIILTKKPDGRADRVFFQGRSQISQPGRRWIADEITYIVDDKRVIATGNAKAIMLQNQQDKTPGRKVIPSGPSPAPTESNARLASPGGDKPSPAGKPM